MGFASEFEHGENYPLTQNACSSFKNYTVSDMNVKFWELFTVFIHSAMYAFIFQHYPPFSL